jgi:hypothetical protein
LEFSGGYSRRKFVKVSLGADFPVSSAETENTDDEITLVDIRKGTTNGVQASICNYTYDYYLGCWVTDMRRWQEPGEGD